MDAAISELIIYACPTGPLADGLDIFFERSRVEIGPNTAHRYMPHCTLTGFFHDVPSSVPIYAKALEAALHRASPSRPKRALRITAMVLSDMFKYLKIESEWLLAMIADFAANVHSPSRTDDLRLKNWLHLSLAYDHSSLQEHDLNVLARKLVDPHAAAGWELRLYERLPGDRWVLHACWTLE
jgi:ubiquitin-associated SH3 domain-containing protein